MELLTISKAAKKLGVHPNSLRNWEKRGKILSRSFAWRPAPVLYGRTQQAPAVRSVE
ncbi:MerR family DNA-binding transcriptional regulator [Desulfofundulus kuznetsovii]|uniref:MerR family DNA-binding transcriptional regulator n=1 Tax=Desulfofundulus kuznetsovii TaxID=58135 RepID=UPI00338DD036